jgi:fatty-acid desaturase
MMKGLSFNQKLQILILTSHLTSVYALFWHFSWIGLLVGYIGWFLFKMIGTEIIAHRYYSHKAFETTNFWKRFLTFLHFFAGDGSLLAFVGVHRTHHAYCETEKDPHSPRYMNWADITYWLKPINMEMKFWRELVRDPVIRITHNYYFLIHFSIFGLFVLFNGIEYYGYVIGLPMALCLYSNLIINNFCHQKQNGYRNYETEDDTVNNKWIMWGMFGSGLHNNHHAKPNSWTIAHKKGEWDPIGWIIDRFVKV